MKGGLLARLTRYCRWFRFHCFTANVCCANDGFRLALCVAVFQKELDTPGESSLEAGKFSGSLACANEAPGAWHVYTARPSERPHAMAGGLDDA